MIRSITGVLCLLCLSVLLLLNSCNVGTLEDQVIIPPSAALAFFHASPTTPQLNIYLNDILLNATFTFKTYSGYLQLTPPGQKKFKLMPTSSTAVTIDTSFTFSDRKANTIVISNKSSGAPHAVLLDDTGTLSNNQNLMLRFVHMSPDTPAVDVKLTDVGKTLALSQSYETASNFVELEARGYTAEIRRSSDNKLLLTVPIPLPSAGAFQSIYLLGYSVPTGGNLNSLSYKITN